MGVRVFSLLLFFVVCCVCFWLLGWKSAWYCLVLPGARRWQTDLAHGGRDDDGCRLSSLPWMKFARVVGSAWPRFVLRRYLFATDMEPNEQQRATTTTTNI